MDQIKVDARSAFSAYAAVHYAPRALLIGANAAR